MKRIGIVLAAALMAGCADTQGGAACDRDCLTGLVTDYLAALVAGDAAALPLADSVRFTEDGHDLELGADGLWAGEIALTDYRFDIIDVREQIAASLVKVEEDGVPVLLALRLLTEEGRIGGVETMAVRNAEEGMIFRIEAVDTLSAPMAYTPAPDRRDSREAMIEIAARYPEGLRVGSFVASDVPFAPEAYRFENGMLMAGPGCTFLPGCDNIREQSIPTLSQIVHRVSAVDEEQGVVLLRMDFGPGSIFPAPGRPENQSLSVFEAFKIYDGQVHAVEAFMEMKPAGQPLGWD